MRHKAYCRSPIGILCIEEEEDFIVGLHFVKEVIGKETGNNGRNSEETKSKETHDNGRGSEEIESKETYDSGRGSQEMESKETYDNGRGSQEIESKEIHDNERSIEGINDEGTGGKETYKKDTAEIGVLRKAVQQLEEYFSGKRTEFELPIKFTGTDFQIKVWEGLRTIPYGETRSYGEMAIQIGSPKAARAVGNANNKNQILILVPCHRVIGADGSLVGFGAGLDVKKYLLELEEKRVH